jgi:hypothetical protein
MITFGKFLTEISANPQVLDLLQNPATSIRSTSKITPDESGFGIIPIRLGYATYNVFKNYINPKYELAGKLLARRGDSVDIVTVKASNEELASLGELAKHIIQNPTGGQFGWKEGEVRTAEATIKAIEDSMAASSAKV